MFNKSQLPLVISISLISGCSVISSVVEKASIANDKAIEVSLFEICNGASVGAVKRQFNTVEKSKLWRDLCKITGGFELAEE